MFQKQLMMRKVLYALIPIYLFAIYLYGYHVLFLAIIIFPAGILTEFIFEKMNKKKVSEAVLVTCALYTLSMPPRVPWWIALLGIIFAVAISKEAFGGFGKNPFNPAIAGRLFVYLSFPGSMTSTWSNFGNFGLKSDAVTQATPLVSIMNGESVNYLTHLFGLRMGSIGESSVILILLAAVYLIFTKTASWQIILSTIASALVFNTVSTLLHIPQSPDILSPILSGSFLFVAVFMATDPVSAPKNNKAKWVYGLLIGMVVMIIRTFNGSVFPEGTSFAILFGNTFALLFDEIFAKKERVNR